MQYNPYAPPSALPSQLPNYGGGPQGGPMPWTVGEALSVGWTAVKTHFATLVFSAIVSWIPGFLINLVAGQMNKVYVDPTDPFAMYSEPGYWGITFAFSIPTLIIAAFFQGGLIKIAIAAARQQTPAFGDLFSGGRTFLGILGFSVISQLLLIVSAVLLFIPWIIFALGMSLAQFYMVDEGLGLFPAMKKSWASTSGHKGSIFLFQLATVGIMLGGMLACCVGVIASLPIGFSILMVGLGFIYARLSGNLTGQQAVASYAPPPAPGPYGPPPGY